MARTELIPAPIDEKNITSDWIYEMFDLGDVVEDNGYYLGFVNHVPLTCMVRGNMADFLVPHSVFHSHEQRDSAISKLKDGAQRIIDECESNGIIVKKDVSRIGVWRVMLLFYFKEEQDNNLFKA